VYINIAQNLYKGDPKKNKKGTKMVQEKFFTLHHCWVELKHDKKQKNRYVLDVPKQMKGHGCT
jgi:hypothetical protein